MTRRTGALVVVALATAAALVAPTPAAAVTGGHPADPGEWPWQVALLVDGDVWCGGSLLTADVVLTAAHCTEDTRPSMFQVVAGTVDLRDRSAGQRRGVASIDQNEDYDDVELTSDLSLLHLAAPFQLNDDVATVELAGPEETAALTEEGDPAYVTGFGATSEDGDTSDVLLEAPLVTYADERCEALYDEDGDEVDGESQVCAGVDEGRIDACYGDSGGPLVVAADDDATEWLQVGIVSWGAGCGAPLRPTVYTQVSAFEDWLGERGVAPRGTEQFDGGGSRIPARGTVGKAEVYPLTIEVDGFEGELTSVAVRLEGLAHDHPEDLDIWLVSPEGTVVTLLSDVGGRGSIDVGSVLVVDQAAPATDGDLDGIVAPTDRQADGQRKGARPRADLTAFAGEDPDGDWQLLVADDHRGSSGSLTSWRLILR